LLGISEKPALFDANASKISNGVSTDSNHHVSRIVKALHKKLPIGVLSESPA
jgi:hypothetical protein